MNVKVHRVEFEVEGVRVIAERAPSFADAAYITIPIRDDGWLTDSLEGDNALNVSRHLIEVCTNRPWQRTATISELQDLLRLLRSVSG